jgi:hypothetical protein
MLAVFYNICGISGRDNSDYYVDCLENILRQNYDFKLVLSSCLNSDEQINKLRGHFGNKMSYSIIQEKLTVNTTFNKAVQEFVKEFGEAERYLYIDSGCNLVDPDMLNYMNRPEYSEYGMISCLTDTDTACYLGMDSVLPVGVSINLHVQSFHNDIYRRYGRIIPDIFRSFICYGIGLSIYFGLGWAGVVCPNG